MTRFRLSDALGDWEYESKPAWTVEHPYEMDASSLGVYLGLERGVQQVLGVIGFLGWVQR